ncbi:MAG TPA: hypothetical protein VHK69_02925 [Chitinophagaceae bacterium]|jgi:hypothetical protein|nr:hypothetical protein [Chitinophagaceae bacterium]
MKKLLVLALSLVTLNTVFAQSGRSRDVILGREDDRSVYDRHGGSGSYRTESRELDRKLDRINRYYDRQILEVRRNRYIRQGEANRQIRQLEARRDRELRDARRDFYQDQRAGYEYRNRRNNGRY